MTTETNTAYAPFEDVIAIHTLHMAPVHLGDLHEGAKTHLNQMLLKYSPRLNGVPLCYSKSELVVDNHALPSAPIFFENPMVHVQTKVLWTLFSPHPETRLTGLINAISREHIGLLVLGYFNAIIHAAQMGTVYVWDDGVQEWKDRRTDKVLAVDEHIEFEVLEVCIEDSVMTLIGSVDRMLLSPTTDASPSRKRKHHKGPSHETKQTTDPYITT